MAKVLVTFYSRTGNTKTLAEMFAEALKEEGLEVTLKEIEKVKIEELLEYDGIAIGSPTYYGSMATEVKRLVDESIKLFRAIRWKGRVCFYNGRRSWEWRRNDFTIDPRSYANSWNDYSR